MERQLGQYVLLGLQIFSYPYQFSAVQLQHSLGKIVKICEGNDQYQLLDAVV
jgi:hypothetical protein